MRELEARHEGVSFGAMDDRYRRAEADLGIGDSSGALRAWLLKLSSDIAASVAEGQWSSRRTAIRLVAEQGSPLSDVKVTLRSRLLHMSTGEIARALLECLLGVGQIAMRFFNPSPKLFVFHVDSLVAEICAAQMQGTLIQRKQTT